MTKRAPPIQFIKGEAEEARLEKLRRLSDQVQQVSPDSIRIRALEQQVADLLTRVAALEA
jgi:hypothetical protein